MIRRYVAVAGAFVALVALSGFAADSAAIFGLAALLVTTSSFSKRPAIGILGVFVLGLASPFALEYGNMSEWVTVIAAILLITFPTAVLLHVTLVADEKRRLAWKVDMRAMAIVAVACVFVSHSVFLFSAYGYAGAFIGNVEATMVQVLIVTFATALVAALMLVPPGAETATRQ